MPEVSEFSILQTYKINSLNPEYWLEIEMDDIAVDTSNLFTGMAAADADPLGVYGSVLEQSSSKEKKTRATSIFIKDNVVLDGTVNIQGIVQNQHLMIYHPHFDALSFLLKVHSDTSYQDIMHGMKKLEKDFEENKDELRTLIRNHFDQFILAQQTVEALNIEMKKKYSNDVPKEVVLFARSIRETQVKFKSQMQPMLDRNTRIKEVNGSLKALEKVKVFTEIPKLIKENRIKKNYDLAVVEYKKGFKQLKEVEKSTNASKIAFFNLIWKSVESEMTILQKELIQMLEQDTNEQETIIVLLMELELSDDTLWSFIEDRNKKIIRSFQNEFSLFQPNDYKSVNPVIDTKDVKSIMQRLLKSITLKSIEQIYSKSVELEFYKNVLTNTQHIMDIVCKPLVDFWNLSQVIKDTEKMRKLLDELMTAFADDLTNFWQISLPSSIYDTISQSPILLSFFFERLLNEFSRAERDLSGMKFTNGDLCSKKVMNVFERIKLKILMITCTCWVNESKQIGSSCKTTLSDEFEKSLELFSLYQQHMLKDVLSIASYSSILDGDAPMGVEVVQFYNETSSTYVHPMILEKIRDSFVDALYHYIVEMTLPSNNTTDESIPLKALAQIRILKEKLIPDLISKFQNETGTSLSSSALKIFKLVNDMDDHVFSVYIELKSKFVQLEIEKTWSFTYFNWCTIKEPRGNKY